MPKFVISSTRNESNINGTRRRNNNNVSPRRVDVIEDERNIDILTFDVSLFFVFDFICRDFFCCYTLVGWWMTRGEFPFVCVCVCVFVQQLANRKYKITRNTFALLCCVWGWLFVGKSYSRTNKCTCNSIIFDTMGQMTPFFGLEEDDILATIAYEYVGVDGGR